MTEPLPLFPLGSVLLPGLMMPLHIFEERYRTLVDDLMGGPEEAPRRFGVVAIRQGREVGPQAAEQLYDVGCTADVRQVERYDDGRFGVVTTGGTRFRLHEIDRTSAPYLIGQVEYLGEPVGDAATATGLAPGVARTLRDYVTSLGSARGVELEIGELPTEPVLLSYVAAAMLIGDTSDKQALLTAPDAVARLRAAAALLRREIGLLGRLSAVSAPDLTRVPPSPN